MNRLAICVLTAWVLGLAPRPSLAEDGFPAGLQLSSFKQCMESAYKGPTRKGIEIFHHDWNCHPIEVLKKGRDYTEYTGRLTHAKTAAFDQELVFDFMVDNKGRLISGPAVFIELEGGNVSTYGSQLTSNSLIDILGTDGNVLRFRRLAYTQGPNVFDSSNVNVYSWHDVGKWLINEMVIQAVKLLPRDHRGESDPCEAVEGAGHRTRPDACVQESGRDHR